MSLRRLHPDQPESFAFTKGNAAWAEAQIEKYPEGRQASAVIPILWRGQEQEGWVTKPMIEEVANMLGMAPIRVLEVASFYFMFQMQPVGAVAHIQVCGTTSCMICGAEDLISVCKEKIAPNAHQISPDGKFSWEEVECLGACSNAPMAQIGKDYYEDLTAESFAGLIDAFARGETPRPGPQNGRFAAEPLSGLTSLTGNADHRGNASAELALARGDTIARILGDAAPRAVPHTESSIPTRERPVTVTAKEPAAPATSPSVAAEEEEAQPVTPPDPILATTVADPSVTRGVTDEQPAAMEEKEPQAAAPADPPLAAMVGKAPDLVSGRPADGGDDLKRIKGVGPKLEGVLNDLGIYYFHQIAVWTPAEVAWVDERLTFKGRILRDDWIAQTKLLGGDG